MFLNLLARSEPVAIFVQELSKSLVGSPEIRAYEENVFGPRAPPRGSSVEQEDARSTSSGTTLSDESPKHTPQSVSRAGAGPACMVLEVERFVVGIVIFMSDEVGQKCWFYWC